MRRQPFHSDKAPQPKGPYSQAIIHNELLYVSGQGPAEPATGAIVRGTIEEQAGYSLEGVLKVTCYLSNMDDFDRFNKVYDAPPASTTVQAGRLPMDIGVEIDAVVGHIE